MNYENGGIRLKMIGRHAGLIGGLQAGSMGDVRVEAKGALAAFPHTKKIIEKKNPDFGLLAWNHSSVVLSANDLIIISFTWKYELKINYIEILDKYDLFVSLITT